MNKKNKQKKIKKEKYFMEQNVFCCSDNFCDN